MKYEVRFTARFKQDYKRLQKRHADLSRLHSVIEILANGETLPRVYGDHLLMGNYRGVHECHIRPDWLLIYNIYNETLVLDLIRTGSHSDLF